MNNYHRSILETAITQREREITEYQVNIDNFAKALELTKGEWWRMRKFRRQLKGLLASSRYEQRKAQIMLDVIKEQLCDS